MILNHIQANTEGDAIAFLIKDNYFISLSIQDLPCNAFSRGTLSADFDTILCSLFFQGEEN